MCLPPSKPRVWLAISLIGILAACATRTPIAAPSAPPANTACTAFGPIVYDRLADTLQTIANIKVHNVAWDAICKSKP